MEGAPSFEMIEQKEAIYRNRSEAPTSVVLALLLSQPSFGRRLLQELAASSPWKMWLRSNGKFALQRFDVAEDEIEANALVFPFRDVQSDSGEPPSSLWRGEIDVVAIVPGHIVIGFELKVLSTTSGLSTQMADQVAGLSLLAEIYNCPYLAQVALTPSVVDLHPRINCLTFHQLFDAIENLGASNVSHSDILAIAARQVRFVIDLIEPRQNAPWCYVPLEDLLKVEQNPENNMMWVGVIEGMENLQIATRTRWKVANKKIGRNWYPISVVTGRIRMKMGLTIPPGNVSIKG